MKTNICLAETTTPKMMGRYSRIATAIGLLLLLLLPAAVQAEDYTYETHNGTITITGYTAPEAW